MIVLDVQPGFQFSLWYAQLENINEKAREH